MRRIENDLSVKSTRLGQARRDGLALFLLALTVRLVVAALIRNPGYMDTGYYAAGAVRLTQGGGFSEPFIWNYLDDPAGFPHPGFLYWMPLPSLLAAPFAALSRDSFFASQIPFAILSAALPVVTYALARRTTGKRWIAWMAGLTTLFSGFFFSYWTLPETFTPFALFGSLALWLAAGHGRRGATATRALAAGTLVGLAHLTRADGILLLPVAALAAFIRPAASDDARPSLRVSRPALGRVALTLLGYAVVMTPWFLRNLARIGAPLSPSGTQTLWLRTYDDLFCYDCSLTLRSYLAWGASNILRSKLWAAGVNLQRFLAENCLIFLLPFTLAGLYRLRRRPPFALATLTLVLIYLAHSFAFTFPGPRGGFFHASAALLPFLHTAAGDGLDAAIGWAARRRRWNRRQARTVFAATVVCLSILLSAYATANKLEDWRHERETYQWLARWLAEEPSASTVMIANPPAFWYHTRHPSVAVPNEGLELLLSAARRYDVSHLVLDENRPQPLGPFYAGEIDDERLELVATLEQTKIYHVRW
ncbi:MAG: glycosyltransferase family 39 protein [Anaerolineae bacterium]|jgi:4-amino-4-deoxy-L-arabinose transferase-like glycosyltransferase